METSDNDIVTFVSKSRFYLALTKLVRKILKCLWLFLKWVFRVLNLIFASFFAGNFIKLIYWSGYGKFLQQLAARSWCRIISGPKLKKKSDYTYKAGKSCQLAIQGEKMLGVFFWRHYSDNSIGRACCSSFRHHKQTKLHRGLLHIKMKRFKVWSPRIFDHLQARQLPGHGVPRLLAFR